MSRDREYLVDMVEAARLAQSYIADKTKEQYLSDIQCQDAIFRRLEIMGEAARRLSDKGRELFPHLPWNSIIGMRNIVIHEYDHVDLELVWITVTSDLGSVVKSIEHYLESS